MRRTLPLLGLLVLAACKPPATEEYITRAQIGAQGLGASEPLPSPPTEGALWAASGAGAQRIIYGVPGGEVLFSLECIAEGPLPLILYTRHAPADRNAKAVLALIGNRYVERLHIDAAETAGRWQWQGTLAADDPRWRVLKGPGEIEATVPGAGSLILNPSDAPRTLIEACAAKAAPALSAPAAPLPPSGPAQPAIPG